MQLTRPDRVVLRVLAVCAALLAVGACGDDDATEAAGEPPTVEIERSRFAPLEIEVEAGETVRFVNLDPFAHTVTASEGSAGDFDSGNLGQDETYDLTLDEPGTYDYFCLIHPTMRAQVVVG